MHLCSPLPAGWIHIWVEWGYIFYSCLQVVTGCGSKSPFGIIGDNLGLNGEFGVIAPPASSFWKQHVSSAGGKFQCWASENPLWSRDSRSLNLEFSIICLLNLELLFGRSKSSTRVSFLQDCRILILLGLFRVWIDKWRRWWWKWTRYQKLTQPWKG